MILRINKAIDIYRKVNIFSVEINMARVSVDEELLRNLLDFKLSRLKEEIDQMLSKWNYISSTEFLKHAKDGTLSEAEMDAISMRQLLADCDRLKNIYDSVSSGEQ